MKDPYSCKLTLAYNGTAYKGWQRQPSCPSVQQTCEEVLRNLYHQEDLVLSACSRTDTGVHALAQTAFFHSRERIGAAELKEQMNRRLPHDIAVLDAQELPGPFRLENAVSGKSYLYAVLCAPHALFLKDACWLWREDIDRERLRRALALFPGTHDFRGFAGHLTGVTTTVRTLYRADLRESGPLLCFHFSGNGFLHKMIRKIMGALYDTVCGTCTEEELRRTLRDPAHPFRGTVAPARGLYLRKIYFSEEERLSDAPAEFPPFFGDFPGTR